MLSADDVRKLVEVFATKEDLKREVERIEANMSTKNQMDKLMNLVDKVFGEVKTIREEQAAHSIQHDNINERLDKMESSVITHTLKKK